MKTRRSQFRCVKFLKQGDNKIGIYYLHVDMYYCIYKLQITIYKLQITVLIGVLNDRLIFTYYHVIVFTNVRLEYYIDP